MNILSVNSKTFADINYFFPVTLAQNLARIKCWFESATKRKWSNMILKKRHMTSKFWSSNVIWNFIKNHNFFLFGLLVFVDVNISIKKSLLLTDYYTQQFAKF